MQQEFFDKISLLIGEGLSSEAIVNQLKSDGIAPEDTLSVIEKLKAIRREAKRSTGMLLIGIGTAICAFSMGYTFFFGPSDFMLYGLTLLGVLVAFTGLVFIMG